MRESPHRRARSRRSARLHRDDFIIPGPPRRGVDVIRCPIHSADDRDEHVWLRVVPGRVVGHVHLFRRQHRGYEIRCDQWSRERTDLPLGRIPPRCRAAVLVDVVTEPRRIVSPRMRIGAAVQPARRHCREQVSRCIPDVFLRRVTRRRLIDSRGIEQHVSAAPIDRRRVQVEIQRDVRRYAVHRGRRRVQKLLCSKVVHREPQGVVVQVLRGASEERHEVVRRCPARGLPADITGETGDDRIEIDNGRVDLRSKIVLRHRVDGARDAVNDVRIRGAEFRIVDEVEREAAEERSA